MKVSQILANGIDYREPSGSLKDYKYGVDARIGKEDSKWAQQSKGFRRGVEGASEAVVAENIHGTEISLDRIKKQLANVTQRTPMKAEYETIE